LDDKKFYVTFFYTNVSILHIFNKTYIGGVILFIEGSDRNFVGRS